MESIASLNALFEYATEGILIVNERGIILRINPSAEKLFQYKKGELLGKPIEVLIPERLAARHEKYRDHYNGQPHPRAMGAGIDLYGKRSNGSEFPLEISLSPYTSGNEKFVVAFIIDNTQRKLAEEKLRNYSSELEHQVESRTLILHEAIAELENTKIELNEALKKERELNDMKSRFVSMASHEFRTPLATILSSVSLVSKYAAAGDTAKQEKHIARIKSSIHDLTEILNDFLSLSKLEEGKVTSAPEMFDLEQFIREIISEMNMLAKQGQQIRYRHSGSAAVITDKKLLKNILFNLISNAIKFSPEDTAVNVVSAISNEMVQVDIKDQGIGISREDQKHLFERFFRGRNATAIQGTGLGLNIVLKYLELLRGTIEFTSAENEGTTFTIKFPSNEKNTSH
jgi:PAS domain S-box-containing protein